MCCPGDKRVLNLACLIERYALGEESVAELSRQFGISRSLQDDRPPQG